MPAEQFVINIITTGDKEAVAAQGRVAASSKAMGDAAKGASAASAAAATSTSQKWQNAGNTASAAGKKITRGVTLPVLGLSAVSGKMAVDFEKSMRNVNSIAQLPEPAFKRLNREVLNMAGPTAQAPKTLAEGLYDLVSSGFNAQESIQVLNASARAATAGLTTTEVSTKAVAAALNAYHRPASDAQQISDDLFQTVNLGVVSFDELASVIGYVLPAANTMGINLKEVGASISTLTKQGQSGSNAVTNINAAITSFIKPSKDMKGVLKELGYESSTALVHQKGFQGALEEVTDAVHGDREAIGELFPNVRSMRAVFGLTGSGAKSAAKDLRGFAHDSGATAKVLKEQSKSTAYQWNQLKAEGSVLAIELGQKLVPVMKDVVHEVGGMVHWFTDLPEGVQTTTIKVLAFSAAMGPLLRIGGGAVTMLGKLGGAMKAFAATDLAAGLAQAFRGDTAILRIIGSDMAGTVMGGLAKGLPIAAAGAGVVNILTSVISGDSQGALEKTGGAMGGALLGGIIGSVVPGLGTAVGAAVGCGAGSFHGPLIGDQFDSGKELSPLQERLADSSKGLAVAMKNEGEAARGLGRSNRELAQAKQRQRGATQNVRQAEQRLTDALRDHKQNTLPVLRAEIELARAKRQNARASQEVKNAERLQGFERKIQMPILRTSVIEARHRINVLKDERQALRAQARSMVENGSSEKERIQWMKRMRNNSEDLRGAEKKRNEVLADASRLIGPKFAQNLQHATREQLKLVNSVQSQGKSVKQYYREMGEAVFGFSRTSEKGTGRARGSYEKLKGVLGPFRTETNRQMGKAGGDVQAFALTTKTAFGQVETSTNTALTSLGVKQVNFGLGGEPSAQRQRKARGGVVRIPGTGTHDTVPLNVMGTPVIAAPGEDIAFITQHQRSELDYAVRAVLGDRNLDGFFSRQNKPHYEPKARGGIVEPRMTGPDPMQDAGQNAIHAVTKAALAYVRKQGGDKSYKAIVDNGNRMDGLKQPYLWGGGHGSMPSRNGPWDCSGGTTELFYDAGWKDLRPMVSGGFSGFGEPGQGKVSVLSNDEHVYSVVGNRAIGTSGENPGGGFGWIDSYTYRPGFTVTHVDLAGEGLEGIPTSARSGKGQRPAKGFAKGGWARTGYTIYSGSGGGAGGNLQSGKGYAELGTATADGAATGHGYMAQVLGMSGELPMGFGVDVKIGSREATLYKKDRGYGQGTSAYSIDIHQLAWGELGLSEANGKGTAFIRAADGSGPGTKEEHVPANFMGCKTGDIDFPPIPKSLHGIEREITRRENELPRYRSAVHKAKKENRTKLEQALAKNVTALENRVKQLKRERALERRKEAQKKVSKKLRRKLGRISAAERDMELAERIYTEADQTAQQIVGLEPLPRELGPNATESARAKAEKEDVADFTAYVNQQEKPAYGHVLDTLADWRNVTLHAEREAGRLETGWEKEVREVDNEIDRINDFTEQVHKRQREWERKHPGKGAKDYPDWLRKQLAQDRQDRARLPTLRYRDREVRKTLGEAREAFYPGREKPIMPPSPPMAGSGSLEEVLIGIQGTHWPDQHSPMKPLPGKRDRGVFGGSIWDTQTVIAELDLKVNQAVNGLGGSGGENEGDAERLALVEEENRLLRREAAITAAQAPVLTNYLGAYEKGGILPDTGYYLGHKGEQVIPADQVGSGGHTILAPQIVVSDELRPYISATVDHGFDRRGRNVGLSRGTPSFAGRRAMMTQRRG